MTESSAGTPVGGQDRRRRRAPQSGERQRDPERTKERILEAAIHEFGAKGFAGARVHEIAERAGVNKQLISYYFGGKDGLRQALARHWLAEEAAFARPDATMDELVAQYVPVSARDRAMARVLAWEGLADEADGPTTAERRRGDEAALAYLRGRQDAGELDEDLDPACVLLAFMGAAGVPAAMPHLVRSMGADPESREFAAHYADQLARIVRHLRPR